MPQDSQEPLVAISGQVPAPTEPVVDSTETQTEPKVFDEAYVKTLRSEAASLRTKLKSFETEALSDLEKAQNAATAAEARATATEQRIAKRDALDALKVANIVDPDLAYMVIKGDIKMNDGEPQNIAALVSDFIKLRPQMVQAATPAAPEIKSTNPSPANSVPQKYIGRL